MKTENVTKIILNEITKMEKRNSTTHKRRKNNKVTNKHNAVTWSMKQTNTCLKCYHYFSFSMKVLGQDC